jgi:hypothetical protein
VRDLRSGCNLRRAAMMNEMNEINVRLLIKSTVYNVNSLIFAFKNSFITLAICINNKRI